MNVTNSTFSGNIAFAINNSSSALGGGIFNDGGTVNVTNSTLSSNNCGGFPSPMMFGGGIFNGGGGLFKVKSTIIALNTVIGLDGNVGSNPDASGTFTSQGFNLIGKRDGSTGFIQPTDRNRHNRLAARPEVRRRFSGQWWPDANDRSPFWQPRYR